MPCTSPVEGIKGLPKLRNEDLLKKKENTLSIQLHVERWPAIKILYYVMSDKKLPFMKRHTSELSRDPTVRKCKELSRDTQVIKQSKIL